MLSSFFFNDTATTEIYTLSLHDALPIYDRHVLGQVHELDTHGGPVLVVAHAVDRGADDAPTGGDGVQLVTQPHRQGADEVALARLGVGGEHALAAAALRRGGLDSGALGGAARRGHPEGD